jgi:hypothetical protein
VIRVTVDEYSTAREATNGSICLADHPHGGQIVEMFENHAVFEGSR